jgi:hypothetical protein
MTTVYLLKHDDYLQILGTQPFLCSSLTDSETKIITYEAAPYVVSAKDPTSKYLIDRESPPAKCYDPLEAKRLAKALNLKVWSLTKSGKYKLYRGTPHIGINNPLRVFKHPNAVVLCVSGGIVLTCGLSAPLFFEISVVDSTVVGLSGYSTAVAGLGAFITFGGIVIGGSVFLIALAHLIIKAFTL